MIGGLRILPAKKRVATNRVENASALGFTIIETLIVLAITGLLFVSFASVIAGKQDKVRFNQAINSVKAEIEQSIGEVQSGFFPDDDNKRCWQTGNTLHISNGVTTSQGTKKDCVFLGKLLQFKVQNTDPEQYASHVIAGLRSADDFTTADPQLYTYVTHPLQYGLTTKFMRYNGNNVGGVAIVTYFSKQATGNPYGSNNTEVVPIDGTSLNKSISQTTAQFAAHAVSSYESSRNLATGVEICFNSGTTTQSGLITIGGPAGASSAKLSIYNHKDCV
jgi:type II secretory pathway pseudopilin PulG